MKRRIYTFMGIALIIFFSISIVHSQEIDPKFSFECSNFNSFLKDSTLMDSIWKYIIEIRPGDRLIFNPKKTEESFDLNEFLQFFGVDENVSFELKRAHQNRYTPKAKIYHFRQYYKDIPIEGAGFGVSGIFAPGSGPDGPGHPCDRIQYIIPYITSDIDLITEPTLTYSQVFDLAMAELSGSSDTLQLLSHELVIRRDRNEICNYDLAWKITYLDVVEKLAYLNAHDGSIIFQGESFDYNIYTVQTEIYGERLVSNLREDGQARLISTDLRVRVYQHSELECRNLTANQHFLEDSIPSTTHHDTWTDEAELDAYQAFFVAQTILPFFDDLNIEFELVNLLTGCEGPIAFSFHISSLEESFTVYGRDDEGVTFATFNTIGHELGHGYIQDFISSNLIGNAAVHEAYADMLGVYANFRFTDSLNWSFGFENTFNDVVNWPRDLSNPMFPCFSADTYPEQRHDRSNALSHLLYLLTAGSSGFGIEPLGIEVAIRLLLDGLIELNSDDADYPQVMHATLNQAIENFGLCSPEFIALLKAWKAICLDGGYDIILKGSVVNIGDCEFFLNPIQSSFCWDHQNTQVCLNLPDSIEHGVNPNYITWTLLGPESVDFDSYLGMQGNQQQGGICIHLIDIPELDYYPRFYNIRASFNSNLGHYNINFPFVMYDCSGTKPNCYQYYNSSSLPTHTEGSTKLNEIESDIYLVEVFDVLGRLFYRGKLQNFETKSWSNQILLFRYLDRDGRFIKSEKRIILNE